MLKHMLTHTGSHPKDGRDARSPSTATVVGIPTMEDLRGSPILESRREAARRNDIRPVSVHGNVIHNQSIYANTVPLAKMMNGGMNISASAPSGRLNASSMNANLNLSNLNSSSNVSPGTTNQTRTTNMDSSREHSHHDLNTTQISPISRSVSDAHRSHRHHDHFNNARAMASNGDVPRQSALQNSTFHQNGGLNITNGFGRKLNATLLPANVSKFMLKSKEAGVMEMITSLGLLCLVSLLLALLSLVFLLKISPAAKVSEEKGQKYDFLSPSESVVVNEVTLAMCALTLSLNLCCLLVCAIQFLFAVKLVKSAQGRARTNKYLKEASLTRICAISGFFISIPVFLTGIILYTFLHFDSTPAIITSVLIGSGIVFCGAAVVHNVFIWQKEKMKFMNGHMPMTQILERTDILNKTNKSTFGLPTATLDLSGPNATIVSTQGLELSTLV